MAIDVEDLKKLSPKMKALIAFLGVLVIGYLYYMFFLQSAIEQRVTLGDKLAALSKEVEEKERTVSQLDKYVREIQALKEAFNLALLKLPNEREIAGILASVVSSGKSAGVDFLLFEPAPPPKKAPPAKDAKPDAKEAAKKQEEKFYEEIPIRVQVSGTFHNTVSFFDQIARLPRIVNVQDISMGEAKDEKGRGRVIKTSCIVKTYMFVDKKK